MAAVNVYVRRKTRRKQENRRNAILELAYASYIVQFACPESPEFTKSSRKIREIVNYERLQKNPSNMPNPGPLKATC